MVDGKWEDAASLAAQGQQLLDRGGADEKDKRRAAELLERACTGNETSLAKSRGLVALEEGQILNC